MLVLLIALLTPASSTAADITLSCMTEIPTTSFYIGTEGSEVVARVIHHGGAGYAPAISGTFTPNDLPLLTKRANLVRKMKDDMTFRWPKASCTQQGELLFQCFNTADVEEGVGGAKFAPFALYTTSRVEEGIAGHQESTVVILTFDVNGVSGASIEMPYPKGSCVAERR